MAARGRAGAGRAGARAGLGAAPAPPSGCPLGVEPRAV